MSRLNEEMTRWILSFESGKTWYNMEPGTAENIEAPEPKKRCPKIHDLIELENAFTSLRDKALLWFDSSAPFRIETITELTWRDLKATNDPEIPYQLIIEASRLKGKGRGKYKGITQVCFIHYLAAKKLEAYKKELSWKGYRLEDGDPIFIPYKKEGKIKPLSKHSIDANFTEASLRAWHDTKKKRFSPQDLRSFVQSAMENAGINPNIIAQILGHKPKGVDSHYSEHDVAELMEKFRLALPYLLPQTIEDAKVASQKELSAQEEKINQQQWKIEQLEHQIEELPIRMRSEMIKMFPSLKKSYSD